MDRERVKKIARIIAQLYLLISSFSYLYHTIAVRVVPITENPTGYLALITPECWYWSVYSAITGSVFLYWWGYRNIKRLERLLEIDG